MRVILVDDEYGVLIDQQIIVKTALTELYPRLSIEVDTTEKPQEALEFITHKHYDIIFADIDMPNMKGIEFCERVEKLSPQSNLFFVTGYQDYSMQAWETFACGFFLKPLEIESVKQACDRLRYPIDSEEQRKDFKEGIKYLPSSGYGSDTYTQQ